MAAEGDSLRRVRIRYGEKQALGVDGGSASTGDKRPLAPSAYGLEVIMALQKFLEHGLPEEADAADQRTCQTRNRCVEEEQYRENQPAAVGMATLCWKRLRGACCSGSAKFRLFVQFLAFGNCKSLHRGV